MNNRNLWLLTLSQVFGFTSATVNVFLSGIIGSQLVSIKTLATLPVALLVIGTAICTVFGTQAVAALSAGYFLNITSWQTINLICLPFLVIIVLTIWRAGRIETLKKI